MVSLGYRAAVPASWAFPAVSVNANGYLVVFASGKDRRVSGLNLHTNFSLRAAGEQLLLTKPDGITVVSQSTFGPQQPDVSYGNHRAIGQPEILIGPQAVGRALVPASDGLGTTWTRLDLMIAHGRQGPMDLGYENSSGYQNLIGLNVRAPMNGLRASCYLRPGFPAVDPADAPLPDAADAL